MSHEPLDVVPLWALLPCIALALGLAMEGGYRVGIWRQAQDPNEQVQPVAAIVAAILGLLALVLGFTFSLAASRFDERRLAVLEEANDIGTAYLRTSLLPEPQRSESARLLKEYSEVRATAADPQRIAVALVKSEQLQSRLWEQAIAAAETSRSPVLTGLYISALNEVIDVHSKRVLVSLRSRIPLVIWLALYGLSFLGSASVGYCDGLSGTSRSPLMIGLVLSFTIVLYLIADLDRGQEGLLQVSQQALVEVNKSTHESRGVAK